jgi:hypothetical protein
MCVTSAKDPIYMFAKGTMINPLKFSSKYSIDTTCFNIHSTHRVHSLFQKILRTKTDYFAL